MGRLDMYRVEQRTNKAISVEAGNGPGRWAEGESEDALARLDAKLNPDGTAESAIDLGDGEAAEQFAISWGDTPADF